MKLIRTLPPGLCLPFLAPSNRRSRRFSIRSPALPRPWFQDIPTALTLCGISIANRFNSNENEPTVFFLCVLFLFLFRLSGWSQRVGWAVMQRPGGFWRFLNAFEGFWRLLKAFEGFWKCLKASEGFWIKANRGMRIIMIVIRCH